MISFEFSSLAPSVGPDSVVFFKMNETTFNISWAPLPSEKSNGIVTVYEVSREMVSSGQRSRRSSADSNALNSTKSFAVLYELQLCSTYHILVRAYTAVGPGPPSKNLELVTSSKYN